MNTELKLNSSSQIIKGTEIYKKGSKISSIGLVVKGTIRISAEGINVVAGPGSFLGLCDLAAGEYRVTYIADTNVVIYAFPVMGFNQAVRALIKAKQDYAMLMFSTLGKYIFELSGTHDRMKDMAGQIYEFIVSAYERFSEIAQKTGTDTGNINLADIKQYNNRKNFGADSDKILYYKTCCDIPQDIQKAFLNTNIVISVYNITDETVLINRMISQCISDAAYIKDLAGLLIKNENSLYANVLKLAKVLQGADAGKYGLDALFNDIADNAGLIESLLYTNGCDSLDIDREVIEDEYYSLVNGNSGNEENIEGSGAELEYNTADISVLDGALGFILDYSGIDKETAGQFSGFIKDFINLKDKMATDDNTRTLRRNITKIFYDLYKHVFLKDYKSEEDTPVVIDLFLKYGFISEKLVSDTIKQELLTLPASMPDNGDCMVYDMKEWLTEIYEGRKAPSKNEFDMDYFENLRDMRKTGSITAEEEQKLLKDSEAKFAYEVDNMFKINHRLIYGQVSVFVPFLYTEGCLGQPGRCFLSKEKINAAVKNLLEIDFSVFYRERLFTEKIDIIKKEYIMEEVWPDFIVFPAFGSNGIMWQEISNRKRNSKGRFLVPAFLGTDINSVMIKLFGRFRWELCRTIQGAAWNNIQMKSLTSEYSDFVQFYRKNKDLSDDKKEKLKLQIQKCRNNTREVFVIDYENWIKLESKGGLCLSKPVREILATYCPFSKDIRDKITQQPLFRDAMARFERERGKKRKEYDLKFRVWKKDKVEVPQEIIETRDFYLDK